MTDTIRDFRKLTSKLPKNLSINGTCNTGSLLRLNVKSFPEQKIINGFSKAISKASIRITTDLKKELDQAIKSPIWNSNNGTTDIYDTGQLMDSGTVTASERGITISYDAPYAALIHYGGYIHPYGKETERIYLPPKPWVDAVLNGYGGIRAFDFAKYYKEEIEREFR